MFCVVFGVFGEAVVEVSTPLLGAAHRMKVNRIMQPVMVPNIANSTTRSRSDIRIAPGGCGSGDGTLPTVLYRDKCGNNCTSGGDMVARRSHRC